jgi:hypothetical protein
MGSRAGGAASNGGRERLTPRMEEGRAANVLGALPVAVYITDAAGKITY